MILLPLLVLILRNHLQDPAGQTPPQGFKYAYYEVIIPRKLTPRYGQQELHHLNYWLQIEGKGNLVHLRQKKGIIPKQFPIFTYSKEGNLQVDYPFIRDDCYYHGFVQDKPSSLAAITTCSGGLRGILRLDNKTYEIIPIQPSTTFQHVVYRLEQKEGAVTRRCGLTEEERRRQEAMMHSRQGTATRKHLKEYIYPHNRYASSIVVVDYDQYNYLGKNDTLIALRVITIVHFSNSYFVPLGIHVSLIGLEIWSQKNFINTKNPAGNVLGDFNTWRRNTLNKRIKNDLSSFWLYQSFPTAIGLAFLGGVCDPVYGSNFVVFRAATDYTASLIFAHETGHNFGMNHDEAKDYCICSHPQCIMSTYQSNYGEFSNCSYKDYFSKRKDRSCMFIPPAPEQIYIRKYCGNKVVEQGEQCDCGSKSECESNPCCQNNCRLRPGATCALGMCCDKCSYLRVGTICRNEKSICDLPEYCNGISEWCPNDFYVQNGTPCRDGTYCYNGSCSTHYDQCQEIFGRKAIVASDDCFRTINIQGDRFGNCGFKGRDYKKCTPRNILCGRIQCEKIDHLLVDEHRTMIQTPIGNKTCWGVDYHSGMNLTDTGAVKDGTPCGTDMMCISGECSSVSLLKYDCDATKCHKHGRCNNLKQCHCDDGWAPPDCQKEGHGGSINSGPPHSGPPHSGPPPDTSGSNEGSNGGNHDGSGDISDGGGSSGGANDINTHSRQNLNVLLGISLCFFWFLVLLACLSVYYSVKDWRRKKSENLRSAKSGKTTTKRKK